MFAENRFDNTNQREHPHVDNGNKPVNGVTPVGVAHYPYVVRPAMCKDIPGMRQVEQEAFPEHWPPTNFKRDLDKADVLYLVAARPWTREERERGDPEHQNQTGSSIGSRLLAKLGNTARSVGVRQVHAGDPAVVGQYIAGFAAVWFVVDETHVVTLASRSSARRKGVADLLLIGLTEAAVQRGSRCVTLEVRKSNEAAIALYRKHGFHEVGIRRRYYSNNNEDAVLMTTPPIQSDGYLGLLESLSREHASRWGESVRVVS